MRADRRKSATTHGRAASCCHALDSMRRERSLPCSASTVFALAPCAAQCPWRTAASTALQHRSSQHPEVALPHGPVAQSHPD